MSFWLEKFTPTGESEFSLPARRPQSSTRSLRRQSVALDTVGGTYDPLHDERLPLARTLLTHTGAVYSPVDSTRMSAKRDALKINGKSGTLYRLWDDGTTREWVYARCEDVDANRSLENKNWEEITFTFLILSPAWNGDGIDDTETLSSSPHTYSLSNDGDAVVVDAVLTLTAGSADITSVTFSTGDAEIQYTGTISAGNDLVIDCGAMSVQNNGTGDYVNFARTANHAEDYWFPLQPGSNPITVTFTGGSTNSSLNVVFYEAWE